LTRRSAYEGNICRERGAQLRDRPSDKPGRRAEGKTLSWWTVKTFYLVHRSSKNPSRIRKWGVSGKKWAEKGYSGIDRKGDCKFVGEETAICDPKGGGTGEGF